VPRLTEAVWSGPLCACLIRSRVVMGQEGSKPVGAPPASHHVDPNPRAAAAATPPAQPERALSHAAAVDAELERMLHFNVGVADGDVAAPYMVKAADLAARARALPDPRPPLLASSLESYLLYRHERTVEEILRRTPLLLELPAPAEQQQPLAATAVGDQQPPKRKAQTAIPNPADAHRALAALQTTALARSRDAVSHMDRLADSTRRLAYHAQLTKSTAVQAAHDAHRAAIVLVAEADALSIAVHGVSCRTASAQASPRNPAAALDEPAPTIAALDAAGRSLPTGLVQLTAEVTSLAREVDRLLTPDDREAVRALVANMPIVAAAGSADSAPGGRHNNASLAGTPPPAKH
jgi:hypothetical protein